MGISSIDAEWAGASPLSGYIKAFLERKLMGRWSEVDVLMQEQAQQVLRMVQAHADERYGLAAWQASVAWTIRPWWLEPSDPFGPLREATAR